MTWRILVRSRTVSCGGWLEHGAEAGRELRKVVPRSSHAVWDPAGRPSPLRPLEETNRHRVPELVPIRAARMRASPFAFLRGAPAVMAHDLSTTPTWTPCRG
jgi:Uncharacterized protein conserved in bacteria (DUF2252)